MSKLCLMVLLGCNSDGNEKLTPLVVGRSCNPRCFKNMRSFPTKYKAKKKEIVGNTSPFQRLFVQIEQKNEIAEW